MPVAVRSLLTGLFVGLLVAFLLPQLAPHISQSVHSSQGSAANHTPLPDWSSMAQVLRNVARNVVRGASGGRSGANYKSTTIAASSSTLLSRSSLPPPASSSTSKTSSASFATSSPNMASTQLTKNVLEAIKERRTYYQLNKEAPISDSKIKELTEQALLHVPSSFNSQSTRIVVLLNKDHEQFWDYVIEVLKPLTPEGSFDGTKQKINGFRAAYGTVLFYEAPEPVENLRKAFPLYAHHFGDWSEHTNAMHQYALWVALEAEGFGANLQHYNPIIDQKAAEHWSIPLEWKLRSQLVFGGRAGEPGEKQFQKTFGERLFVHGSKE